MPQDYHAAIGQGGGWFSQIPDFLANFGNTLGSFGIKLNPDNIGGNPGAYQANYNSNVGSGGNAGALPNEDLSLLGTSGPDTSSPTPSDSMPVNPDNANIVNGGAYPSSVNTSSPAMAPAAATNQPSQADRLMAAISAMKVDPIDYVQNVNNMYSQIYKGLNDERTNVDNRYDNVNSQIGNLYNGTYNAALKDSGVFQALGDAQRAQQQGNVASTINALNSDRSAQLQDRMAMAQRLGMPLNSVGESPDVPKGQDPTSMAIRNAAERGNTQQAANDIKTNSNVANNDLMAKGIQAEGLARNAAMQNQKLNFDTSLEGKVQAAKAQESQALANAITQNYQNQLARIQAGIGLWKDQADVDLKNSQAMYGDRGPGYNANENSSALLNQVKAMMDAQGGQTATQAANVWAQHNGVDPAVLNSIYTRALTGAIPQGGTAPTIADELKYAQANIPEAKQIDPNVLNEYLTLAGAKKPSSSLDMNAFANLLDNSSNSAG